MSTLHATLLLHFEDESQWESAKLAETVGISTSQLAREILFLVNNRLVRIVHREDGVLCYEAVSEGRSVGEEGGVGQGAGGTVIGGPVDATAGGGMMTAGEAAANAEMKVSGELNMARALIMKRV